MPPTATAPPRKDIDEEALAAELEKERGEEEDDGLGAGGPTGNGSVTPEEYEDPNSEYNTGVPGGRKPGDDGYVEPEDAQTDGEEGKTSPPTPPADLAGTGEPEAGQQAEETVEPEEPKLAIMGDRELGLKVGGKKPDSATLHLRGGKIELSGSKGSQFDRGDRFLTVTTLQVTGDNDQDTIVKHSGEVTSASKKQLATLCGIERIEPWVKERLLAAGFTAENVDAVFGALELEVPEG